MTFYSAAVSIDRIIIINNNIAITALEIAHERHLHFNCCNFARRSDRVRKVQKCHEVVGLCACKDYPLQVIDSVQMRPHWRDWTMSVSSHLVGGSRGSHLGRWQFPTRLSVLVRAFMFHCHAMCLSSRNHFNPVWGWAKWVIWESLFGKMQRQFSFIHHELITNVTEICPLNSLNKYCM